MTKMTKSNKGWRECSQKLMSLSPIFSMPIFSSTEFSILRISCGSDNVKVASVKTHLRGFLCVCCSCITRSKATFCQRGLLLPVYLCVKVNVKIAGNSCFRPFVLKQPCIYIYLYKSPSHFWFIPRFVIFYFFSVLVNEKGGGALWKKLQSVILEGEGFKKCHSALTFFQWPRILEINNFQNF